MVNGNKFVSIGLTILLGIAVQVVFVSADCKDTPYGAAIEFTKAYFQLNPSMSERICEERRTINDVDVANSYIQTVYKEARDRGFDLKYMKAKLYHIETHTVRKDETSAEVRLTAERRSGMNPLYAYAAKLLGFSKPRSVEQTFNVIKEDGTWKVCGGLFSLPKQ